MRTVCALLAGALVLLALAGRVTAIPNHLDVPAIYDNAEPPSVEYGQTFVAQESVMVGIRMYIGDPSRPGDPRVDELTGPADLVVYEASDLLKPVETARSTVVPAGTSVSGLVSLLFEAPVPTVPGKRYYFSLRVADAYGIGLRAQFVSTYADGAEAVLDPSTGVIDENPLGRDLSFEVLSDNDDDGDGVRNAEDDCPASDLAASVVIAGCDSETPNAVFPNGCTISDLVAACHGEGGTHGLFVSCVSDLTNDLKQAGAITGRQRGAIQSCSARADIP